MYIYINKIFKFEIEALNTLIAIIVAKFFYFYVDFLFVLRITRNSWSDLTKKTQNQYVFDSFFFINVMFYSGIFLNDELKIVLISNLFSILSIYYFNKSGF